MRKTALVTGATGLVGRNIIDQLINDNRYNKVIIVSRRAAPFSHPKIEQITINFDKLSELMFKDAVDECYCALGTTQKKSGKKGFFKVDFEYVKATAGLCGINNIPKFSVVSSNGANPKSTFLYMRTKGQMEEAVKSSGIKQITIVRPSLITGKRDEFRFGESAGYYLYKLFQPFMLGKFRKLRPISAEKIARCMIELNQQDWQGHRVVESDEIAMY
ncbi:MAG: NAD(P)H-binding protein [Prolixibacteraceae bacterium]|nr:NAD(P)H-binding protein [Prolixibacteraceae bacterium]